MFIIVVLLKKIVGIIFIKQVLFLRIEKIWEETKEFSGMSKKDFFDYFKGKEKGYAIEIKKFKKINPIDPRKIEESFFPPQSFFYLNRFKKIKKILNSLG